MHCLRINIFTFIVSSARSSTYICDDRYLDMIDEIETTDVMAETPSAGGKQLWWLQAEGEYASKEFCLEASQSFIAVMESSFRQ